MNKIFNLFVGVFAIILTTSMTMPLNNDGTQAHIEFKTTSHNFGKIYQNANGKYSFKFTNTGKEPLIIQGVRTSCGCTVASRPSAPILPGESSEITVKYDTRRIGVFHKNITVTSNADNASVVLYIKGEVQAKPKEDVPLKPVNKGFTPVAN